MEISDLQAGFRQNRGTRDLIVDLTSIIQKAREWQIPLYMCFIDYKKAFDTVKHDMLWKALKQLGWPIHYIHLLSDLYDSQNCRVRTAAGTTSYFKPGKGVRQGCPQSPDLFSIYTEIIMRDALEEDNTTGFKIGGRTISHLRYADDTVLIATSADELQTLINQVNQAGKGYNLRLNVKKTKIMRIRTPQNENLHFQADNEIIEEVDSFTYLGVVIRNDGNNNKEVKRRIAIAKSKLCKLDYLWKSNDIRNVTKWKMMSTIGFSIALYGVEAWNITTNNKTIEAFEAWCARRLLDVSWRDKKSNEWVFNQLKSKRRLLKMSLSRKGKFIGHVARHQSLEHDCIFGMVPGEFGRLRGRPATRMLDDIKIRTATTTTGKLKRKAEDRNGWRKLFSTNEEGMVDTRLT